MQTKEGFTEKIIIGKGVKQGGPLSPSLFNLGIDPLIRNIRERYQECGYSYDTGKMESDTSKWR
jgi:retron-type reverse transcriptase